MLLVSDFGKKSSWRKDICDVRIPLLPLSNENVIPSEHLHSLLHKAAGVKLYLDAPKFFYKPDRRSLGSPEGECRLTHK